jgi:hypothetical protein
VLGLAVREALLTPANKITQARPIRALVPIVVGKLPGPSFLVKICHPGDALLRIRNRDLAAFSRRKASNPREDEAQINGRVANPVEQFRDDMVFLFDNPEQRIDFALRGGDLKQAGAEESFRKFWAGLGF